MFSRHAAGLNGFPMSLPFFWNGPIDISSFVGSTGAAPHPAHVLGNMLIRADANVAVTETFTRDSFNRATSPTQERRPDHPPSRLYKRYGDEVGHSFGCCHHGFGSRKRMVHCWNDRWSQV